MGGWRSVDEVIDAAEEARGLTGADIMAERRTITVNTERNRYRQKRAERLAAGEQLCLIVEGCSRIDGHVGRHYVQTKRPSAVKCLSVEGCVRRDGHTGRHYRPKGAEHGEG